MQSSLCTHCSKLLLAVPNSFLVATSSLSEDRLPYCLRLEPASGSCTPRLWTTVAIWHQPRKVSRFLSTASHCVQGQTSQRQCRFLQLWTGKPTSKDNLRKRLTLISFGFLVEQDLKQPGAGQNLWFSSCTADEALLQSQVFTNTYQTILGPRPPPSGHHFPAWAHQPRLLGLQGKWTDFCKTSGLKPSYWKVFPFARYLRLLVMLESTCFTSRSRTVFAWPTTSSPSLASVLVIMENESSKKCACWERDFTGLSVPLIEGGKYFPWDGKGKEASSIIKVAVSCGIAVHQTSPAWMVHIWLISLEMFQVADFTLHPGRTFTYSPHAGIKKILWFRVCNHLVPGWPFPDTRFLCLAGELCIDQRQARVLSTEHFLAFLPVCNCSIYWTRRVIIFQDALLIVLEITFVIIQNLGVLLHFPLQLFSKSNDGRYITVCR